jgi:hypothetical protein
LKGGSRGGAILPERQSNINRTRDAAQKPTRHLISNTNTQTQNSPNANQKNIAPAFFVLHHPLRPFLNASPSFACGSLLAFLHPGSVQAEIVTINLAHITMSIFNPALMIKMDARNQKGNTC